MLQPRSGGIHYPHTRGEFDTQLPRYLQGRHGPSPRTLHRAPHHSPTPAPANASIVNKIRFNPNSRPLLSNHSCKVCAPPPDPPPPMAIASSPSDNGIFASV